MLCGSASAGLTGDRSSLRRLRKIISNRRATSRSLQAATTSGRLQSTTCGWLLARGVGQPVDVKSRGENRHRVSNPIPAMLKGQSGRGIDAEQKRSSDAPGHGVDALDFVWVEDVVAGFTGQPRGFGQVAGRKDGPSVAEATAKN